MKSYLDLLNRIFETGVRRPNRTGVVTTAIPGFMFEHNMTDGFPLLTTKFVPFRLVASELEFFLRGYTDKKWLQDRNNRIWNEWARQDKVKYGHSDKEQAAMRAERDLGPIYGWQWRHFGAEYPAPDKELHESCIGLPQSKGVDQLWNVVQKLKTDPDCRRMVVSAWNPPDIPKMGLPPCHWGFQVLVMDGKLNLLWNQRSVDTALGLPFNIASYALLLHLLAKESGFAEGKLIGFLADTHIYENHVEGLRKQLSLTPKPLPSIQTEEFSSIFHWKHTDSVIEGYEHHPKIPFPIAV